MAYVSLYRKYRPQTFAGVVGQDHVTRTLTHAIEESRLHHAYLFTGPRGTGKTSTARILAKAINCEQGPTPTPCNACEHCTSITDGSSVDVIELDMASHGGVDDARELRDRALFAPARTRRKVYVLDEVHMASTAAFNALLKLIEEPPEHVLFAMATTDPQKVLPTILSRVQRLDLRRVSAAAMAEHVRRVCAEEGYLIDDGAVDAVVRAGEGSVRDTLSVLEQVLAYAGTEVSAEAVAQVLGNTPADRVFDAVARIAERDLAGAFALVQSLLDEGHDLRRFTLDLVGHLRDLLVLQVAPDRPDLVDATDERRRRLQAQTTALPRETMLRAVDVLAQTVAEQRQGSPRLPLELALAQLAVPTAGGDLADLADRVARLEAGGTPSAASGGADPARAPSTPGDRDGPEAAAGRERAEPAATSPPAPKAPEHSTPRAPVSEAPASSDPSPARSPEAAPPDVTGAPAAAESPASAESSAASAAAEPPAKETPLQARARARAEAAATASSTPVADDGPPPARSEAPGDADPGAGAPSADAAPAEAPGAEAAPHPATDPAPDPPEQDVPAAPADRSAPEPAGDTPAPGPPPAPAARPEPSSPAPTEDLGGDAGAGADVPPDPPAPASDAPPATPAAPTSDEQAAMPAAPAPDEQAATPGDADDDQLEVIERHWDGILDLIKRRSRRCHAVFEPATPSRASRGILTLRYPRRYASFHAQNAGKGEYAEVLKEAVERACGLRMRVEATVEGDDDRRRPQPPSVTPADARTPVVEDGPTPDEEAAVREAELSGPAADPGSTDELLARELDARLLSEDPPSA